MDLPPEILVPDVAPGTTILYPFVSSVERIIVVAVDPEGESLAFVWQVPAGIDAEIPPPVELEGGITSSEIVLPADPALDDTTLALSIFDPGGNDADIYWDLVIP